jgi:hypothetical protein
MIRQFSGETLDIVRWSEPIEEFIRNALAPAKVKRIVLDAAAPSHLTGACLFSAVAQTFQRFWGLSSPQCMLETVLESTVNPQVRKPALLADRSAGVRAPRPMGVSRSKAVRANKPN